MPTDVVTGATGLLGHNLVRTLVMQERCVRILARPTSNTRYLEGLPRVEVVTGDVTDVESLLHSFQGVENVYHCAATVSMWSGNAEQMWAVNVQGTKNVLLACKAASVARLVHCSSVDAIGLPESARPSDEETPWNWNRLGVENVYARTKYEAQKLVLTAAQTNVNAVVVNPTYMFGAYDVRPSSGQMILSVASSPFLGYPSGGNNFVSVDDVATAMVTSATKGRAGECYILGNANLTYEAVFHLIAEIVGRNVALFPIPRPAAQVGGWIGDLVGKVTGREPSINSTTVQMGYTEHYYSSQKAVRELGMPQTPVNEAIERAVSWFRQTGMLAPT